MRWSWKQKRGKIITLITAGKVKQITTDDKCRDFHSPAPTFFAFSPDRRRIPRLVQIFEEKHVATSNTKSKKYTMTYRKQENYPGNVGACNNQPVARLGAREVWRFAVPPNFAIWQRATNCLLELNVDSASLGQCVKLSMSQSDTKSNPNPNPNY